jgi:3-oxoacyl-[acyl-carrier protein] reductase
MQLRGFGRIVGFGLAGAERLGAYRNVPAHAVAKAALVMLARALALALAKDGITVNVLCPGVLEGADAGWAAQIPAGRPGKPADILAALRFLLSDEAGYVTGASLPVAGGYGL